MNLNEQSPNNPNNPNETPLSLNFGKLKAAKKDSSVA